MQRRSTSSLLSDWLHPRMQLVILVLMLGVVLIGSQTLKAAGVWQRNGSTLDVMFMRAGAMLRSLSPIDLVALAVTVAVGATLLRRARQ